MCDWCSTLYEPQIHEQKTGKTVKQAVSSAKAHVSNVNQSSRRK